MKLSPPADFAGVPAAPFESNPRAARGIRLAARGMPVCIAGMHRSGTSMVTRMLALCGLDLGPDAELLPPAADNPDGFFENMRFAALNQLALAALGGRWDAPPTPPGDWSRHPALRRHRMEATTLVAR